MFGSIRSVFALALAGGMVWSCGGDRVTMSPAPELAGGAGWTAAG